MEKNYTMSKLAKVILFPRKPRFVYHDKQTLLNQMVDFQERRKAGVKLDITMILEGIELFKSLESTADTEELRVLSKSYFKYLEHELKQLIGEN